VSHAEPPRPDELLTAVIALHGALADAGLPHAFGGAVALARYGAGRPTDDLDVNVFVGVEQLQRVRAAVAVSGEESAPDTRGRWRTAWHSARLDVFFACEQIHVAMAARARVFDVAGRMIPFIAPEHLIVRKAIIDRPKDRLDIGRLLEATRDLDLEEIERWMSHMLGAGDPRAARLRGLLGAARTTSPHADRQRPVHRT